jgi:FkbM family methyltransferase
MAARLGVKNDWLLLAASLTLPNGAPRFHLGFPKEFAADPGANCLVTSELKNGYELPTRNLLERAIRPGDLFVDVGAHWGFFTLQAATHPARGVTVVGFEPDPANAAILVRNVADNGLTDEVSVVCVACGDDFEIAPLVANSTMMHTIRGVGLKPPFARGPSKWVPVVTLDRALVAFPRAASARIILKVDAVIAIRLHPITPAQNEKQMARLLIRHRELISNEGSCRPSSVKRFLTRSSAASAASRSLAVPAPAQRGLNLPQLLAQLGLG